MGNVYSILYIINWEIVFSSHTHTHTHTHTDSGFKLWEVGAAYFFILLVFDQRMIFAATLEI